MDDKSINRALQMRRKAKARKPKFVRYESWRYKRLDKTAWRRQRGLDNKARLKLKGWEVSPSVGFRGPSVARDLHPSGYEESIVHNLNDLEGIDPKKYAVRIAHTVGTRKRMLILGKAEELGLKVLNPVSEIAPPPAEVEAAAEEEETEKGKQKAAGQKEAKKEEKKKKTKEEKKTVKGKPKKDKKKTVKEEKTKKK